MCCLLEEGQTQMTTFRFKADNIVFTDTITIPLDGTKSGLFLILKHLTIKFKVFF